jgi:hypothetical protein
MIGEWWGAAKLLWREFRCWQRTGHKNRTFLRSRSVTVVYRCNDCGAIFFQHYFRRTE